MKRLRALWVLLLIRMTAHPFTTIAGMVVFVVATWQSFTGQLGAMQLLEIMGGIGLLLSKDPTLPSPPSTPAA